MIKCGKCPYKYTLKRNFGKVYRCLLEPTEMDVTYYHRPGHLNEENTLCPFICKNTRIPEVDYNELSDFGKNGEWRPPQISAKNAWNILSHHILHNDYYIVDSVNEKQANAIKLLDIVERLHR